MSSWISKSKRKNIYAKTDNKCFYCGCELNLVNATIDHIIPKSKGGKNNEENLVPCCRYCNASKHLKTLEEYRLYISFNRLVAPIVYSQRQVNQINSLGLLKNFGVTELHIFYFEKEMVN